jgi:hypothetical protein
LIEVDWVTRVILRNSVAFVTLCETIVLLELRSHGEQANKCFKTAEDFTNKILGGMQCSMQ